MREQNDCLYDFESFRIDTLKRQLMRDGQVLPLTSKAFATLLILVRHQGVVVTKDELMNAVWFDTAVEENNLTQQISTLRKALGEQTREPRFIITIPGQGYSFIALVKESFYEMPPIVLQEITRSSITIDICENEKPETQKINGNLINSLSFSRYFRSYQMLFVVLLFAVIVLTFSFFYSYLSPKPSIVVLPFRSLDNSEKSNLYSAGIPSYVTAKIGNLPNMIVRPVDSSGKYFGQEQNVVAIGRDNNADTVLTGSTRCEGDIVRIIVHLWDVKNNRQIWAKVFTRNASDALGAQDSISEEIIFALRTELLN